MKSTETYYADTHIFTSRSNNDTITIKCSNDENLKIKDIQNETIYSRDYTDNFGLNEISQERSIYQHSSPFSHNQGERVSMAVSEGVTYLITSAYLPDYPTDSGVAVFTTTTDTFTENPTLLVNTSFTSNSFSGVYNAINENADTIVFSDFPINSSSFNIYKRTGSTWSFSQIISGGLSVKVSGSGSDSYIVSQTQGGALRVFKSNGTSYSLQQTLVSNIVITHVFDICDTNTIALSFNGVRVFTRTDTTWTEIQYIVSATVNNVRLTNNFLFFTNANGLYIYKRADSNMSTLFTLFQYIAKTGITLMTSFSGDYIFIHDGSEITIYKNNVTSFVKSTNATEDTLTSSMACTSDFLALGKDTLVVKGQIYVRALSEYTNTIVENNRIDMITTNLKLKSEYGSVEVDDNLLVEGNAEITGALSVSGIVTAASISQVYSMKLAIYKSGTSQSITELTDTKVLFPTLVSNEITFLEYFSGDFVVSRACKVLVMCSMRHTNTDNEAWIRVNETSDFYGQLRGSRQLNNCAILNLEEDDYFNIWTYTRGSNSSISNSNDPWNVSVVQIYVLS